MKIIGIIGMIFILAGLLPKEKYKLHLLHTIGCAFLTMYAILIVDWVFLAMNSIMVIVNFVQYIRGRK